MKNFFLLVILFFISLTTYAVSQQPAYFYCPTTVVCPDASVSHCRAAGLQNWPNNWAVGGVLKPGVYYFVNATSSLKRGPWTQCAYASNPTNDANYDLVFEWDDSSPYLAASITGSNWKCEPYNNCFCHDAVKTPGLCPYSLTTRY